MMSPVEMAGTPSAGAMRAAKVPLPTPGAPRKTRRVPTRADTVFMAATSGGDLT
jgi:hypothetical protein